MRKGHRVGAVCLLGLLSLGSGCTLPEPAPEIGAPAPPVAATLLEGGDRELQDYRGEVVLLNLWATWCVPCRTETPFLQGLHERFGDRDFTVIGVSVDHSAARRQVERFVSEAGVTYPILLQPAGEVLDDYGVVGLPATFLIDEAGIIRWMRLGPVDGPDVGLPQAIEELL